MKYDPCQAAQSSARTPASPPSSTIALTSTRPHPGALSGYPAGHSPGTWQVVRLAP
jgi:hypothetical protein